MFKTANFRDKGRISHSSRFKVSSAKCLLCVRKHYSFCVHLVPVHDKPLAHFSRQNLNENGRLTHDTVHQPSSGVRTRTSWTKNIRQLESAIHYLRSIGLHEIDWFITLTCFGHIIDHNSQFSTNSGSRQTFCLTLFYFRSTEQQITFSEITDESIVLRSNCKHECVKFKRAVCNDESK